MSLTKKLNNFLFQNHSEKQTILKNTFWLMGSDIIARTLRFLLIIYVARILGADGWGLFSYALSFIGFTMMFSDGGISLFFIKEYTERKNKYLKTILILKIIALISTGIFAILSGFYFASLPISTLVVPVTIILLTDSLRGFLNTFLRAQEVMEKEAIVTFATNLAIVIFATILVTIQKTPESLALGYMIGGIIGTGISFILNIPFIKRTVTEIKKPGNEQLYFKPTLKFILPITLITIINAAIANIDSIMLGIWTNSESVGFYATAQRLFQVTLIIPNVFISALYPTLARAYTENRDQFVSFIKKSFNSLFLIGAPIALGGFLLSHKIILFFFGNEYFSAGNAFAWLIFGIFLIFPASLFQNIAIITKKQTRIALHTFISLIIAVIINWILIPRLGVTGAALGTTIAYSLLFFLNLFFFKDLFTFSKKTIFDTVLASIGVGIIIWLFYTFHIIIIVILSSVVYFGILRLLKNDNLISLISIIKKTS